MNKADIEKALSGMTAAQRNDEERRQSQIMAEAISELIMKFRSSFEVPMFNAVAGAIVTVEASLLASCDAHARKMLRKAMADARPRALAAALTNGGAATVVNVTVRKHDA